MSFSLSAVLHLVLFAATATSFERHVHSTQRQRHVHSTQPRADDERADAMLTASGDAAMRQDWRGCADSYLTAYTDWYGNSNWYSCSGSDKSSCKQSSSASVQVANGAKLKMAALCA